MGGEECRTANGSCPNWFCGRLRTCGQQRRGSFPCRSICQPLLPWPFRSKFVTISSATFGESASVLEDASRTQTQQADAPPGPAKAGPSTGREDAVPDPDATKIHPSATRIRPHRGLHKMNRQHVSPHSLQQSRHFRLAPLLMILKSSIL